MGSFLEAARMDAPEDIDYRPSGAREDPEPGVTGALIAERVPLPADRVVYAPDRESVPALVAGRARPGDIVLTMGAGDVTELGPRIVEELAAR